MADTQPTPTPTEESFFQKIEDFFTNLRKEFFAVEPVAAKVAEIAMPEFAPLIGIADSLAQAAGQAAAAHDAAKTQPGYDATQSAITSAGAILQAVVDKAPALGLDTATVTIINKVTSQLPIVATDAELIQRGPYGG